MRSVARMCVGMGLGVVLAAATTVASPVGGLGRSFSNVATPEQTEVLKRLLVERERELQELQKQLASSEEENFYARAEVLGVASAVQASKLPAHAQRRVAAAIVREAERNGVDPMLVVAVIRAESSFNSFAVSNVGALGLMQVMPKTGAWLMSKRGGNLGPRHNLFDQELNIELGTAYLADLIRRFGTAEKALVAYNAGPGAARKILANDEVKKRFVAGYPAKVLGEFRKLKAQQRSLASKAELSDARQPRAKSIGQ